MQEFFNGPFLDGLVSFVFLGFFLEKPIEGSLRNHLRNLSIFWHGGKKIVYRKLEDPEGFVGGNGRSMYTCVYHLKWCLNYIVLWEIESMTWKIQAQGPSLVKI